MKLIFRLIFFALFGVTCILVVRSNFIDIYKVKGSSMEPTLKNGQYILVNKMWNRKLFLSYKTDTMSADLETISKDEKSNSISSTYCLKPRPFFSFKLNFGDVVIVDLFSEKNWLYVKRCIGMPGDNISIHQDTIWINGNILNDSLSTYEYKLCCNDLYFLDSIFHKYNVESKKSWYLRNQPFRVVSMNKTIKRHLINEFTMLKKNCAKKDTMFLSIEAMCDSIKKEYSIPQRGDIFSIDSAFLKRYGFVLEEFEKTNVVNMHPDSNLLYSFTNDYYFILGDNRTNSIDSRAFGMIPEYSILGRLYRTFFN